MGTVTDLTIRIASDDELRRRATEGDQDAIAELCRRGGSVCEEAKAA
jgi:hypothetical protein